MRKKNYVKNLEGFLAELRTNIEQESKLFDKSYQEEFEAIEKKYKTGKYADKKGK